MKRYFICFLIIGCLSFVPSVYAQTGNPAFVGTWKLLSIDYVDLDGNVTDPNSWLGKKPTGLIIYDTSGHISLQLMRDPEERGSFDKYYAYFGTYQVIKVKEGSEGKEGVVLHHLQGSLSQSEIGVDYRRMFKISGNRLMLTTPENWRFTFERVEKRIIRD
jgi:hypothetical protein